MYTFEAKDLVISPATWTLEPTGYQCSSIDISKDDEYIAYSNNPGIFTIVERDTGKEKCTATQKYTNSPIVSCKFLPLDQKFVFYAYKDGFIFVNDLTDFTTVAMTRHLGSSLLLMAMDSYGETFSIACADGSLRIYDTETLQRTQVLLKSNMATAAHNRGTNSQMSIYSIVYHPVESSIIAAATSKDGVLFWDLRTGNIEQAINGPHIRGNGLDIHDNTILTASYRDNKQIEFWDFRNGHKIRDIQVENEAPPPSNPVAASTTNLLSSSTALVQPQKPLYLTCAKIAENGFDFVVGATEINAGLIYSFSKYDLVGQTNSFKEKVSACAISSFGTTVVTGSEDGSVCCNMIRVKDDIIFENQF